MPVAATFAHLLDDAGSPPAPRSPGVPDGLVGTVAVRDDAVAGAAEAPLPVTLVGTGGAGQVAAPLATARRRGVTVAALHLTAQDPSDPAGATRRLVTALEAARDAGDLDDDVAVRVGLPAQRPGHGWLAAADEVVATDGGLLLPLGDGVPAADVVAWLDAALSREVPVSVATGDHPAVSTGRRHGLLNLLLATRSSLDGAAADDLEWLLGTTDAETLVDLLVEHGDDAVARARRFLTSAAVTDVAAVAGELRAIGLLA